MSRPDKGDRERSGHEEIERLQEDIREETGTFDDSGYWDDFREHIYELRKFGPRRYVVWDDDGPRLVREYWDEEAREWIEDDGRDRRSG